MDGQYLTALDKLGMHLAAQAVFEKNCGMLYKQILPANIMAMEPLVDILKRDAERTKDGFSARIKFRRVLVAPGKVIVVPYVKEEQLIHGEFEPKNTTQGIQAYDEEDEGMPDLGENIGHGDGEVGDVIGQVPLDGDGDGDGGDDDGDDDDGDGRRAGDGSGEHGFDESAYELGRRLMEELQLPNLKEKAMKVPTDEYVYDLTDRHRGAGQLLDKRETLKRIVRTNLLLGRVTKEDLDMTKMLIAPQDLIFRVFSKERVWKSQAVVFFIRDYSGSMFGDPTRALLDQHLMIYAWLLVQYEGRVIPRFIVHDYDAREVTARQYFRMFSGGGTLIASAYKKVNAIVEGEGLESQYNIYVFQGTDGDDGENGTLAIPAIEKILSYANRMGVCLFKYPSFEGQDYKTAFEEYIIKSGFLNRKDVFRMHILPIRDITEEKNIEALKALIAQG